MDWAVILRGITVPQALDQFLIEVNVDGTDMSTPEKKSYERM